MSIDRPSYTEAELRARGCVLSADNSWDRIVAEYREGAGQTLNLVYYRHEYDAAIEKLTGQWVADPEAGACLSNDEVDKLREYLDAQEIAKGEGCVSQAVDGFGHTTVRGVGIKVEISGGENIGQHEAVCNAVKAAIARWQRQNSKEGK